MIEDISPANDIEQRSMHDDSITCGNVEGTLHFYKPPTDGSDPQFEVTDTSGAGRKNYGHNPVRVVVSDLREREQQFSLAQHSFAAVMHTPLKNVDFTNVAEVKERYALDAINLIMKHLPTSKRIVVFDATIRRASPENAHCRPVRKVHVDQTPFGVCRRVKKHLTDREAAEFSRGDLRVRLINVWRPILGPVHDHPLTMAESLSVEDQDLVKVKHIYPDYVGETYAVKYNPSQRFWYWSNMSTEDVLLLQCFDSVQYTDDPGSLRSIRCAHASFTPVHSDTEQRNRQSIEIRCLVLG